MICRYIAGDVCHGVSSKNGLHQAQVFFACPLREVLTVIECQQNRCLNASLHVAEKSIGSVHLTWPRFSMDVASREWGTSVGILPLTYTVSLSDCGKGGIIQRCSLALPVDVRIFGVDDRCHVYNICRSPGCIRDSSRIRRRLLFR
ncbi:hypothetical protein ABKN59_002057 [Abortiporus biennis]